MKRLPLLLVLAALLAGAAPAAEPPPENDNGGKKPVFELAILTVNGRPITQEYIVLRMGKKYQEFQKARIEALRKNAWTEENERAFRMEVTRMSQRAIRTVVLTEILRTEAEDMFKLGYRLTERQVEKQWKKMLDEEGGPAEVARKRNISVAALKELARDELMAEAFRYTLRQQHARPTPQELADYYKFHSEEFRRPESVRARVIFIRRQVFDETLDRYVEREGARKRAEDILVRIRGGEDFDRLAKRLSEEPDSAARGGLIGQEEENHLVKRGDFKAALEGALFETEPEEISEVVEDEDNLYIVKVLKHYAEGVAPYEEVEEKVRRGCYLRRIIEAEEDLFRRSYHKIQVLDEEGRPVSAEKIWPRRRTAPPALTPTG